MIGRCYSSAARRRHIGSANAPAASTSRTLAGSGTATGLAWRIVESGNRLEIPTLFAALALLGVTGVAIFAGLSLLEWLLLRRWHESALNR